MRQVVTAMCVVCRERGLVEMPEEAYRRWTAGEFIQQAWPEGSAGDREQLINGTHSQCFDRLWGEEPGDSWTPKFEWGGMGQDKDEEVTQE